MTAEFIIPLEEVRAVDQLQLPRTQVLDIRDTPEGVEAVIGKDGVTYPLTVTPSFGPEIVNPELSDAVQLAYGNKMPVPNPNAPVSLLVPLQANGRCGADCKGCVFANHRVGAAMNGAEKSTTLARPVDADTMQELIAVGKRVIHERELTSDGQTIRVNALLSGDPSFSPHVGAIMCGVMADPDVSASRWSTIAVKTPQQPLETFVQAARWYSFWSQHNLVVATHKPRFQVSLHSTDPSAREAHVGHYRGGQAFPQGMYTMGEIAASFKEIKDCTGFKSTLSFVLHADSVIDPEVLSKNISPNVAIICVRPIIPTDDDSTNPMSPEIFAKLYTDLRERGYDVIVMPPIGLEMDNINAKQYHRSKSAPA